MRRRTFGLVGLALLCGSTSASAQEIEWRAAGASPSAAPPAPAVSLGRPERLSTKVETPNHAASVAAASVAASPVATSPVATSPLGALVIRGQIPDGNPPPPPPPPTGALGAPIGTPAPGEEAFNCGVANTQPGEAGFFSRLCDNIKRGFGDIGSSAGNIFQTGPGAMFHSDDKFNIISPVSNPFYFEDPRALTELRPIFMWQHTPSSNPVFSSSDNFFLGLQARVAFTENISLVINKLGVVWAEPNAAGYSPHTGFSELWLGPKFTFIRNETSGTLLAAGLTFQIPTGPSKVFQNTGDLSLVPYLSYGQSFWRSDYGTFNFLNTTGYAARVDSTRTDNIFSSFHLDYDIRNLKKIYPLIELNFAHYTFNGSARDLNFEGRDLFNFGSNGAAGINELTLALGVRYKVSEALQFGFAAEAGLLGGDRHMDGFRLTFDVIFRY